MYKKELDPEYSGVNIQKIKDAQPKVNAEMLKRYAYYQKERTAIYDKKEIQKLPSPWSEDVLFQNFKFTMTKRYLDRESKNLINGILNRSDISFEDKLLNCVAFRMINKWKAFEVIPNNYVSFEKHLDEEFFANLKNTLIRANLTGFFTDAYMISGTLRALKLRVYGKDSKIPKGTSDPYESFVTIFKYIQEMKKEILLTIVQEPDQIVMNLQKIYGIGKFIAYQIYADWTYIKEFPFSDNSCCDIGPGTERGLKHFFDDFDGLNLKEAVYWVRENIQSLCDENGLEWNLKSWFHFLNEDQQVWTLQDVTNSFCEFDKTTRIWTDELRKENSKRVRKFDGRERIPNECSLENF